MLLPTLRQLEYFLAVAEESSFRRAAERCLVTQPAMSTQIQQLERVLGVVLFERNPQRVLLTAAGEALRPRAQRALLEVHDLVAAARSHDPGLDGPLRLGVIPTIAPYLLPEALPAIHTEHPGLQLFLHEATTPELVRDLHAGKLDLLLLALDADLGGADTFELFDDPFLLLIPRSHPLAGRKSLEISEISELELMLLEEGHCLRDQVLDICGHDAPPTGDFRASSLNTLVRMVAGGVGATLLPFLARTEVRDTDPVTLIPLDPMVGRRVGLAWRPSCPRHAAFHAFGGKLKAAWRDEPLQPPD